MCLLVLLMGQVDIKSDIPSLPNGVRVTDLIDFRPRVKPFDINNYMHLRLDLVPDSMNQDLDL